MTAPDDPWRPAPRPRPRRLGLWLPYIGLALAFVALSGIWFWSRSRIVEALEAASRPAAGAPTALSFAGYRIHGFPFRLDVDLDAPRLAEPSGWSLEAPQLKAEALIFAPDHWVVVAPSGVVVGRRAAGPLQVSGRVLRASLSDLGRRPPRLSVEGVDLTFATPPGARPFLLASAKELHLHAKAGPDDHGAAYLEIDQADARLSGLLARIAQGKPATLVLEVIWDRADAMAGPSLAEAMRNWAAAGGHATLSRLQIRAGDAVLQARPASLAAGPDGRLQGTLQIEVRQAARVLGAMSETGAVAPLTARTAQAILATRGAPIASLPLHFEAGRTTLGPLPLGPAPKLF